jgi:hypothetical protein
MTVRAEVEADQPYRRGVHQTLAFTRRWADRCGTLDEVKELLARAEKEAHTLRHSRKRHEMLLCELSKKLKLPMWG